MATLATVRRDTESAWDVNRVRADFPILTRVVWGAPLV
jgi:hypothetical protein